MNEIEIFVNCFQSKGIKISFLRAEAACSIQKFLVCSIWRSACSLL